MTNQGGKDISPINNSQCLQQYPFKQNLRSCRPIFMIYQAGWILSWKELYSADPHAYTRYRMILRSSTPSYQLQSGGLSTERLFVLCCAAI